MVKFARLQLFLVFLLAISGAAPAAGQDLPGGQPDPFTSSSAALLFFPVTLKDFAPYTVSGQITDEIGRPLNGVVISDGGGGSATTGPDGTYSIVVNGLQGNYSFSPLKADAGFAPSTVDLDVHSNISSLDFTGPSTCGELIANGGFETDEWWERQNAGFSTAIFNSGGRALLLGQSDGGGSVAGVSTATTPVISISSEAKDPQLRLWIFTQSVTVSSKAPSAAGPADTFFGPDTDPNDLQALQVLDANGQVLETVWEYQGANNQEWGVVQYNLYKYSGQNIRLRLLVQNDGLGGESAMFVDDMSLSTCPTIPAPEVYNPTGAPEEELSACSNQLVNPGFETIGGWGIPNTAFPAGYRSRDVYPEEVWVGNWSMRTGIPAYRADLNRYSYSDFWQTVFIPGSATSAQLVLYNKMVNPLAPSSAEIEAEDKVAEKQPAFAEGAVWGEQPLSGDWTYILVLDPHTGVILQTLGSWSARNSNWKPRSFDLMPFRGRNIRIQMGTYNDGGWNVGVQSMYVDEAYVNVCAGALPPPPVLSCPAGYSQRLSNNSFEASHNWYLPVTAYSAHYTSQISHSGSRSMQTGIVNPWHNRYSYSDFGQLTVVPGYSSSVLLKFWAYRTSNEWNGADKQYLLVLNNWGYWIDTLLWNHSSNTPSWVEITRDLTYKPYNGWPVRLQFGTYNNGWGGVTAMFVDDVTLCTK